MTILDQLKINDFDNKFELEQLLLKLKKKELNKQNAADLERRTSAERNVLILNKLQDFLSNDLETDNAEDLKLSIDTFLIGAENNVAEDFYDNIARYFNSTRVYDDPAEEYNRKDPNCRTIGNFLYGIGNLKLAEQWYEKSIKHFGPTGYTDIGDYFTVKNNFAKALEYYNKAKDAGVDDFHLINGFGLAYLRSKKYKEAFEYFQIGAERGYGICLYNLAVMYENGYYVEKDNEKALIWYKNSYNEGYKNAIQAINRVKNKIENPAITFGSNEFIDDFSIQDIILVYK